MKSYDVVIIGGGPAGLSSAISCKENGVDSILILERENRLGGILNQCIHNGFGLHTLKEELTGPEYAQHYIDIVDKYNIEYKLDTTVVDISKDKVIQFVNKDGLSSISAKAIILAMGCRERPRGALSIPGFRPSGIYSAGTAQKLINIDGLEVGKEVVILGSGDIGLIMARRLTLEGCHVNCVCEILPYSTGLKRNIVQCLNDYNIPLLLNHTIIDIKGKRRVKSVVIAEVDDKREVIKGSEKEIQCDAVLLSCGLLPENELSKKCGVKLSSITSGAYVDNNLETSVEGVFACGNVLHVHDLVDNVSNEAYNAGLSAALYIKNSMTKHKNIEIEKGEGIIYTVPSFIDVNNLFNDAVIRFRLNRYFENKRIMISINGNAKCYKQNSIYSPGEMEECIIPIDDLRHAQFIKIYMEDVK